MESSTLPKRPNWDLGTIYKQSWQLTKKHKQLWILGLAVSILVTSSGNSSRSSSSSSSSTSKTTTTTTATTSATIAPPKSGIPAYIPLPKGVDRQAASEALNVFGDRFVGTITPKIKEIPLTTYLVFIMQVLAIGTVAIVVAAAASAWSRAALIHACGMAAASGLVNLSLSSKQASRRILTFLAIDYLPWMKMLLILLAAAVIGLVGAITKLGFILPLAFLIGMIFTVILAIKIIAAQIWAYRFASLNESSYQVAMEQGRTAAKGNIGQMAILGFVNTCISGVISFVIALPFSGVSIVTIISAVTHPTSASITVAIITTIISIIIATPLLSAKAAIMTVFSYFTWHLAFKHVASTEGITHATTA